MEYESCSITWKCEINTLLKVELKSMDKLLDQLLEHSFNKGCSFFRGSKWTRIETCSRYKGCTIDLDSNITWLFTTILFLEKIK